MKLFNKFYIIVVVATAFMSLTSCEKDEIENPISNEKIQWNISLVEDNSTFPKYEVSLILYAPTFEVMEIEIELKRNLSWEGSSSTINYSIKRKDLELGNVPYSVDNRIYTHHFFSRKKFPKNPFYETGNLTKEENSFSVRGYIVHNGVRYYLEDEEYIPQP